MNWNSRWWLRFLTARPGTVACLLALGLAGCAGPVGSRPGAFQTRLELVNLKDRSIHMALVRPEAPRSPAVLVLYATGDAGWVGVSGDIFERLAEQGHFVAAYDSRELLAQTKRRGRLEPIEEVAATVETILEHSKRELGLPDSTPVIVTGYSRGANLVVFAAGVERLRAHLTGAVAIALTRETDFLRAPPPADRPPSVQVDAKGRIQTYPAIARAGPIPFAVLQSKVDKYVSAEESRRLFGSDTSTRRLYEVEARNHGFAGGRDQLLRALDDAMAWIEEAGPSSPVR